MSFSPLIIEKQNIFEIIYLQNAQQVFKNSGGGTIIIYDNFSPKKQDFKFCFFKKKMILGNCLSSMEQLTERNKTLKWVLEPAISKLSQKYPNVYRF